MRYSLFTLLAFTAVCAVGIKLWIETIPPSMNDWNRTSLPDGKPVVDECYAYEHFYGKSRNEASELLADNDMYYTEDFSYMPQPAFDYYFPTLVRHVTTEPLEERNVIGFLGLVRLEIEFQDGKLDRHASLTVKALRFIQTHAEEYGELEGPYGLFETRLNSCIQSDFYTGNGG